MQSTWWRWAAMFVMGVIAVAAGQCSAPASMSEQPVDLARGRAVYETHCYQCHGYDGRSRTVAASYLEPPPRDFTRATLRTLSRSAMLDAVSTGRAGSAMVSFARVLADTDITAVVDYIRERFMAGNGVQTRYHTAANGWPDHERYAPAFPFVTGEIPLSARWEALIPDQRLGKRLFLTACVTCHDAPGRESAGTPWAARAVSYPRATPPPGEVDALSGATPYALHERPAVEPDLSAAQGRGKEVYLANCAFCHAPDGTARNWVGSFLEPSPRDLTRAVITRQASPGRLREVIEGGLPGTSMPAWKNVLSAAQIADLIAYLERGFGAPRPVPQSPP